MGFEDTWAGLPAIGRDPVSGVVSRPAFGPAEADVRRWFRHQAGRRGFRVLNDRFGNLFATWRVPMLQFTHEQAPTAILTGSHFDASPGGSDSGLLGIASAFAAIDLLRERGFAPERPVIVAGFAAGSASRFPIESLGARLAWGSLEEAQLGELVDGDGVTWPEALVEAEAAGEDAVDLLGTVATCVEVAVEPGAVLREQQFPVGMASRCWARARYRVVSAADPFADGGPGDPVLTVAFAALAADKQARRSGHRAIVERMEVLPGAGPARSATVWLDLWAPTDPDLIGLAQAVIAQVSERSARDGTTVSFTGEWADREVEFDAGLAQWLAVEHLEGDWPRLECRGRSEVAVATDSGISSALILVRSQGPGEVTEADRRQAVYALADTLARLARTPAAPS
ncbi:MAG: hypothetical protein V9F00_15920 [Nocardioides sp.]